MRQLSKLFMLLLVSMVLVSCTAGEEDNPEPTAAPTSPPVSTTITEPMEDTDVGIPGTPEIDLDDATPEADAVLNTSTPVMSDEAAATPVDESATPATDLEATPEGTTRPASMASPVATPQPGASPVTTPVASEGMIVPVTDESNATPAAPSTLIEMTGTIVLNGNRNETYVVTDEGCVGLGQHAGLHEGRQVVIRDENGTIVSVTTIETAADADGCAWEFWASVPESEFYAVSIPMEFEQVFTKGMVSESDGEVTIELP